MEVEWGCCCHRFMQLQDCMSHAYCWMTVREIHWNIPGCAGGQRRQQEGKQHKFIGRQTPPFFGCHSNFPINEQTTIHTFSCFCKCIQEILKMSVVSTRDMKVSKKRKTYVWDNML